MASAAGVDPVQHREGGRPEEVDRAGVDDQRARDGDVALDVVGQARGIARVDLAVHAQDQLFATLDPTMRGLVLPDGRRVILSDTVGFISELPTELVAAFRATLEEVAEADLILHVRDAAHPDSAAQRADVLAVQDGMTRDGTLDEDFSARTIEVLNKADLLGGVASVAVKPGCIAVSAVTGEGLDSLSKALDARLAAGMQQAEYDIGHADGARLAWLYEHGEVIGREDGEDTAHVTVRLLPADRARFEHPH